MKTIPERSRCCSRSILSSPGKLYCHECGKTVVDLSGVRRISALAELRWEALDEFDMSLMWRNLRVAYARDVPKFVWRDGGYEIVGRTFKWVIGCSNADFSRIAMALCLRPLDMSYPGRNGFASLEAAAHDLRSFLVEREGENAIPLLPKVERTVLS